MYVPKAKLACRQIKILLTVCMRPAAIALNYSIKDIQNDIYTTDNIYIYIL